MFNTVPSSYVAEVDVTRPLVVIPQESAPPASEVEISALCTSAFLGQNGQFS